MEIRDRGQVIKNEAPQLPAQGGQEQQASINTTDAFQKTMSSTPSVDIRKAAGTLLRMSGGVKGNAKVSWTKELSVNGSPLIGPKGMVFVSDRYPDKALHGFDPATGTEMWQRKIGNDGPHAPLLAPDGSLILGASDGQFRSIDPATGKDLWTLPTNGFHSGITIYEDGRASFLSNGELVCVDLKTHKVASKTPINVSTSFEAEPVLGPDGTVYGGGHDGYVYALESGTGREKWKAKTDGMLRNSPIVGPDGTVYAGCIGKAIHAINPADGSEKWKFPTDHWILPSPVVGPDGTVYAGNSDNFVYAIDPTSGQKKWEFYMGAEVRVAPTPADNGLLYVVTDRNKVLCLDQQSGLKMMEYQADSYIHCPPAADGRGNFYFGCNNGRLYAMNVPSITDRVEMEEAAKNQEARIDAGETHVVDQEDNFVIVDGMKLEVKK
jgi:outer membrane protein assembly factor BamB